MIELLILIILICLFTGCSVSDAIGTIIAFAAVILFGGMMALFVMALVA
jgi:hypothetical protein